MSLNGQLALDFISLSDFISVCSGTEVHRPYGSATATALSRTADSFYSAVNVAY